MGKTEEKDYMEQAMSKIAKIFDEEDGQDTACILEDIESLPASTSTNTDVDTKDHTDGIVTYKSNEDTDESYSYISETVSMTDMERKTVLITGGARRIGKELVLAFARKGWNVIIHCNKSIEEARVLAKNAAKYGGNHAVLSADLADIEKVRQIFPQIANKYRKVDCLINNASIFEKDLFEDMSEQSWSKHIAVNVTAPLFLMQDFTKQYFSDKEDETGNIINITDAKVFAPTPSFFSYQISKATLNDITKVAAISLAPKIRVNGVALGLVLPSAYMNAKQLEEQEKSLLLKRKTSLKEICSAVSFLVNSPSITGETIVLASGSTL